MLRCSRIQCGRALHRAVERLREVCGVSEMRGRFGATRQLEALERILAGDRRRRGASRAGGARGIGARRCAGWTGVRRGRLDAGVAERRARRTRGRRRPTTRRRPARLRPRSRGRGSWALAGGGLAVAIASRGRLAGRRLQRDRAAHEQHRWPRSAADRHGAGPGGAQSREGGRGGGRAARGAHRIRARPPPGPTGIEPRFSSPRTGGSIAAVATVEAWHPNRRADQTPTTASSQSLKHRHAARLGEPGELHPARAQGPPRGIARRALEPRRRPGADPSRATT